MATINEVYIKVSNIDNTLNGIDSKLEAIKAAIKEGFDGVTNNNGDKKEKKNETPTKNEKDMKISQYTDLAVSIANGITNLIYKQLEISLKKQQINIEAAGNIFKKQIEAFNKSTSIAIESIVDLDGKNIVSNSIKRLGNMMDASTELFRNQIEQNLILFNREQDIKIQNIESEKSYFDGIVGTIGGAAKMLGGVGIIVGGLADVAKNWWDTESEYREHIANLEKIQEQQITERAGSGFQAISDYAKNFIPMWEKNVTEIIKLEDESYALGRIFGYTQDRLSDFSDGMFRTNVIMSELGKNWEDFLKIQRSYMDTTGRSIQLTGSEGLNISALAQWTGISDEESARLAGNMQIFNKGAVESSESIFKMSQTAQSMGLSNQKFVKDLEKNLRLAQKYDFKNGTKGLMSMALFAQRTRMDMSQLDAILSGFHTGNIEDVITKAAQLNVLGGNAALISNPIGMLYDAYANPKGMGERVLQSISGMGFFNRNTGETEFGIAERMRIEQIAKAMGMSPENLTEMARQENKGRELNRLYGEKAFGKYSERVKQQAYYENGEWKVNIMGESGETQAMSLSAIQGNASLLEKIMPDTEQGQLLEITKSSLSTQQRIEQATRNIESEVLHGAQGEVRRVYREDMVSAIEESRKFISDFQQGTIQAAQEAVKLKEIFNKTDINWSAIDAAFNQIKLTQENMLKISENKKVQEYIQAINRATDYLSMIDNVISVTQIHQSLEKEGPEITRAVKAGLEAGDATTQKMKAILAEKYPEQLGKTKQPKDAIILPGGKVIEPDENDFHVLLQEGGRIQQMMGGSQTSSTEGPRSINITGEVLLRSENGQSVDVVKMINDDRDNFYRVATNILFPNQGQSRVNV